MNYWWVNQNQTYKQEIEGGYMWSPKTKRDGSKNTFYDNMTKVKPGDIVFSFFGTLISFLGVIKSHGYSCPKPDFGESGRAWDQDGWMVNVEYRKVRNKIRPKDHIDVLRPYLPARYSPLQSSGGGNQGVYLAHINEQLANTILHLIGEDVEPILIEAHDRKGKINTDQEAREDRIESLIRRNSEIDETEKETLVKARKGQGKFRQDVILLHKQCPFTGVNDPRFLKAGHLKPWAECDSNQERMDPRNGLLLSPVADLLIDQGLAAFNDDGKAIFSGSCDERDLAAMGIDPEKRYHINVVDDDHRGYIAYHREHVFKD